MLQPGTLSFLSDLANNNNKEWFDANRQRYAEAKDNYAQLAGDILQAIAPLDNSFSEQKAKDCVFRIFRDVRFSKAKVPYKSHFGAFFSRGGKKYEGAGYYLHIEQGNSFAGGGVWGPYGELMKKLRQEIDYNIDELNGIVSKPGFKKLFKQINGEKLKTLPQGYEADNPAIEFLKMKSFTVSHHFTDKEVLGKTFVKQCADTFTAMKPLVDFLNRAID